MTVLAVSGRAATRPRCFVLAAESFGWNRLDCGAGTIWFRGHVHGRSAADIAAEAAGVTQESAADWLDSLDGHFSLIVDQPGWALAASDPVRSYPLIWARDGDAVVLTHDGRALEARLGLDTGDIDPVMARAVALSGFTIGDATLYPGVRQIGPGEYLWIDEAQVAPRRYHLWDPWRPDAVDPGDLVAPLSTLNRRLIEDLITSAGGRTILVPLSGGLDSRFVISGLREAGYENARCVAYGLAGNRDAVISREIAHRLGYDWTFVPYTRHALREAFHSDDHARYEAYSDSLTGVHFPQEYWMLSVMCDRHGLPPDAIVANGQAGDFIAGNHVPAALLNTEYDPNARLNRIVDAFAAKHFKQWTALQTDERLAEVQQLIRTEIETIGGLPDDAAGDHGIYEYCEFQDRQSKYVLNGQRIYEYLGFDWRLPLWDRAYMDFWARAPLSAKRNESLYRQVLERDNWADVWRDIPTNPTRLRPGWVVPLRLIAKLLHGPLGKARWHGFEKHYLEYWMGATCAYAAWPWRTIARDRRGHASAISWHTAAYLEGKGIDWDGTRIETR